MAQRLCSSVLTFVFHYPFLNGLAASACSRAYMATLDSCFAYCLGRCFSMFACSTAAWLLFNWITWVICCVALGCRLWTHGPSSVCFQDVSVPWCAWSRSTHSSCNICHLTYTINFAARLDNAVLGAPHAPDMLCGSLWSVVDPRFMFTGLVAGECSVG